MFPQRWRRPGQFGRSASYRPVRSPRRHYVIPVAILAIAILVSAGLWWAYPRFTDDKSQPEVTVSVAAPAPSVSPSPRPKSSAELANEQALRTLNAHPAFYNPACWDYPPTTMIRPADLVPNANVNIVFTYDENKGEYVAKADRRVKLTLSKPYIEEGEGGPMRVQDATWSYMGPVHLYSGVEMFQSGGKPAWNTLTVGATETGWSTWLFSHYGKGNMPIVMVVATDTSTCQAGDVALPNEGDMWRTLGQMAKLKPQAMN